MKGTVIMVMILQLCSSMHKNDEEMQDSKFPPRYEVRSKIYAQLSQNQEFLNNLLGEGLTSSYQQMLTDQKKYFVSKGLTTGKQLDISKNIALNNHPTNMKGLGYSYGELMDPDQDKDKQAKEAFTTNYAEMLMNPNKKVLVLGLHPELNTQDTRTLQPQMEDPLIQLTPNDVKDYTDAQNKRIDDYTNKMAQFINMMQHQADTQETLQPKQMDILNQINAFIKDNSNFDQIKALKQSLESVMAKLITQQQNTFHGSGLLNNTNSTPAPHDQKQPPTVKFNLNLSDQTTDQQPEVESLQQKIFPHIKVSPIKFKVDLDNNDTQSPNFKITHDQNKNDHEVESLKEKIFPNQSIKFKIQVDENQNNTQNHQIEDLKKLMFPQDKVPSIKLKLNLQANSSEIQDPEVEQLKDIIFPENKRISPIKFKIYENKNQTDFEKYLPKIDPLKDLIFPPKVNDEKKANINKSKNMGIEQLLDQNLLKYQLNNQQSKTQSNQKKVVREKSKVKTEQRFKVLSVDNPTTIDKEQKINNLISKNDQKMKQLNLDIDNENFFKDNDKISDKSKDETQKSQIKAQDDNQYNGLTNSNEKLQAMIDQLQSQIQTNKYQQKEIASRRKL